MPTKKKSLTKKLLSKPLSRSISSMKKSLSSQLTLTNAPPSTSKSIARKKNRLLKSADDDIVDYGKIADVKSNNDDTVVVKKTARMKSGSGGNHNVVLAQQPRAKTLVGEVSLRQLQEKSGTTSCEKVLNEQLLQIKSLLLRVHATKMSHDPVNVGIHLYKRAQESVEEELSKIIVRLINYQGPSPFHRVAAYAQLSTELTSQLEETVFTEDNNLLFNAKSEHRLKVLESSRTQAMLQQELAMKEQTIASLASDKNELEMANRELLRSTETMQKELQKALRNQSQTHQHAVEVRMQGLDYKAEVDRHCTRVLASIQSRMGFIPTSIQKEILYLKVLKAPGDPHYDEMRMNTFSQSTKNEHKKALQNSLISTNQKNRFSHINLVNKMNEDTAAENWSKRVMKAERNSVLGPSLEAGIPNFANLKNERKITQLLSAFADDSARVEGDEKEIEDIGNNVGKSNYYSSGNTRGEETRGRLRAQRDWVRWAMQPVHSSASAISVRATYSGSEGGDDYLRSDTSTDVGREYDLGYDSTGGNSDSVNVAVGRTDRRGHGEDKYVSNSYEDDEGYGDADIEEGVSGQDVDFESDTPASRKLETLARKYGIAHLK